ncbi:DUF3375 family protein [Demequina rhizosphaerae]|uniref:DUF3375 family protein n=1 Tax=Demequina rhizosphaerae TaxID=1638985 RepID=UPI00155D9856|nr:DUF3375 family protein [Demequina rhizosphaerae]
MPATARALRLLQRLEEDAAWRLLRADNAPIVAALLKEHLDGEHNRLAAEDVYERIDADLEDLRAHGLSLPQTAQADVKQWRDAGFVVRRSTADSRGETLVVLRAEGHVRLEQERIPWDVALAALSAAIARGVLA